MLGGICCTYLFLNGFAVPISGGECPLPDTGCHWATICQGQMLQFSTLWGLRQSPLEPRSNEAEKDEDQGKAESSIKQAAEAEICYCFVLLLIKKIKEAHRRIQSYF